MKLRWTAILILLVILLAGAQVEAQKRRKGDKKKETTETEAKPEVKPEVKPESPPEGKRKGKGTTTTTTTAAPTTTTTTTPEPPTTPYEEEAVEEEVAIVDQPRTASNECPPELKEGAGTGPCTCRDKLDDDALMVECVALTSGQQMHEIFNTLLKGKRIDALEVRNSTLGPLVSLVTAQAYAGSVIMRGNEITELAPDSFKGTDQIVGRLDLGSNQITRVDFTIFNGFTQLQVLNLGQNLLTSIEDAGEAPNLRVLYLFSNRIDAISPNAFQRLPNLEYLDLRWNNLQVLAPASLAVSADRWQLRLRSNQISTLDQVFSQDHLPYLVDLSLNNVGTLTDVVYGPLIESALLEGSKIYLAGNPIQCDCSLAWLAKNGRLLAAVVGGKCDGEGGMAIGDVNIHEFAKCPPPKPWYSPLDKAMADLNKEGDSS